MANNLYHDRVYNTLNHPTAIQAVRNATTLDRQSFSKQLLDPRRSINDECGYLETSEISSADYRELYDRESVATRTVQVLPMECWKFAPTIYETEDPEQKTEFEKAWNELSRSLLDGSTFENEEGSPIWEHLFRADILSGIGRYGTILLGLGDGAELSQEASQTKGQKLLFIRTFDETLSEITTYETDPNNPRFGKPTAYNITLNAPENQTSSSLGIPMANIQVHHSRIVHLADNLGSSELFGTPRMQPIYNRLIDLRKLYGGSAEMYWRGAFPGISFESHPQLGGEVSIDSAALKRQIEDYQNTLQRYLATTGMTAKQLAPAVVDPTPQIQAQIEAICILLGIPKRIFLGSERGELSSNQDASTWNDRIKHRQNRYITPRIIVPFVDKLIALGILPEPKSYTVVWPDLNVLSEQELAMVADLKTKAMASYVGGNVESMMVPIDYLTKIIGMSDNEALQVVESAVEEIEKAEEEEKAEMLAEGFELAPKAGFQTPVEDLPTEFPKKENPFTKNESVENIANEFNLTPSEVALMESLYDEQEDFDNED